MDQTCSNNGMLTPSEVFLCLGPSLAQVFFEYSHNDTKKLLDLITPQKLMKTCYTIPISDQLNNNVVASSSTNNEMIKTNVHENILEIGDSLLECFCKQIEKNFWEKVKKQSQEKFHMYQAKKRREVEQKTQELHSKYKNYIKTIQHEMQEQLEVKWAKATTKCAKNIQKAVVQERMNVTHDMMQKMRTEILYVVQLLYKEFENSFRGQRENLIADFNGIIREMHVKLNADKREFKTRVGRHLHIQKRQLQMQSTVDIIFVLCLEQLQFCKEKHIIHEYFQKQISGLRELITRLNNVITVMREEIINCHLEKRLLEEQLCNVTKQFQKCINFILNAVPRQAEYLLPLELQQLFTSENDEKEEK